MIGGAFGVTLANARAGDEAAFACIFRDVQPALLRYLRVIAADPEDVAGETWVQVVAGLRRFRGEEQDFRAWLFTIARHRAADAGRSRARRPAVPLDMTEAAQQLTSPDTADQALEAVSTQAAMALIASLPHDRPRSSCCGWWPAWMLVTWPGSWARLRGRSAWPPIGACAGSLARSSRRV